MSNSPNNNLHAHFRLSLTEGVGNLTACKLLTQFGSPEVIFTQAPSALRTVVSQRVVDALNAVPADLEKKYQQLQEWLSAESQKGQRHVLTRSDANYPYCLLETADPPLLLYAMGNLNLLQCDAIAMVGTRQPTPQGLATAHAFASQLSQQGIVVVSGLAVGIDASAHEGALKGMGMGPDGRKIGGTIAIIGTGLDRVYPRSHLDLARKIAEDGLLLSEFSLGTPPIPANFPKRNRIISALSLGTLVVEAALKSGSLITARMALEQNKEVFAIPGSIHAQQSKGCHALIKQGAKLVESASEILEDLRAQLTPPPLPPSALLDDTNAKNPDKKTRTHHVSDELVQSLGYDAVSFDTLVARTGWSAADLQVRLMELELEQQVARLAGGLYQRVVLG